MFRVFHHISIILLLSSLVIPAFAGNGTTTANFLKIGAGARAIGMGEAFTGVSDDVTAVYWNPAGLGQLELTELSVMDNQWIEKISNLFLGYGIPLRKTVVKEVAEVV